MILQKREFREDLSRSVITTRYALVSKGSLNYITKREVPKYLARRCSKIILKTNKIPAKTTVAEGLEEKKPVELIFNYSKNESFSFQITEELLEGKNPKQFIEKIITKSSKEFVKAQSGRQWIVGYAPHGRGLCKNCKRQIRDKELRLREMESQDSVLNPELYHFNCFPFSTVESDSIHGINKLKEDDQRRIQKKMK